MSCSSDDNSTSSHADLIKGLWKFETINGSDLYTEPTFPIVEYEFKANGDFFIYTNGNIDTESTWSFNADQTKITFNNDTYDILSINNANMVLMLPFPDSSLNIEHGFSRVD